MQNNHIIFLYHLIQLKSKFMKIAHINNTSGVASRLALKQISKGYKSDVFVFNRIAYQQFGGIKFNYSSPFSRWKFFNLIKSYDVWHYHYPYGSLKSKLEKKHHDKIFIKHYHGSDLRGKFENDFCFVSTPDLLQFAPNGVWIPIPVDIDKLETISETAKIPLFDKKPLKIAHYPYYKIRSHEDNYREGLLHAKEHLGCEIINIINLKHDDALKLLSECDIVIGKIMPEMGWFSTFELEGMFFGKPVIAYISDDLYNQFHPPVYKTTKITFKQDLETFLTNPSELERLSLLGKTYVREFHSIDKISEKIEKYYNKM